MSTFLSDRFDSAVGENLIGHIADVGGAWVDYNLLAGWVDGSHYIGSGGGRILFGIDRGVARSPAVPGNAFGQYDLICYHNGGGDGAAALFARMSSTEATGYMVAHEEAFGSPVLQLKRYDAGVTAGISTSKAMAGWTTPKTLSIKMEDLGGGTHRISALVDGVVELSFDDPSPIAGPGFVLVGGRNGNGADLVAVDTVAGDTTLPTLTGTITLSGVTTTGFTATCPVATDNVAVTGYQYNLDSAGWVDIAAGGRSITFTGLTPGATYSVQMRAKDAVPNYSSPLTASQTLPTGGDTTMPTLTGAVVATAVTQTGYTLTWPAGADNVAVTSYERSLDGGATWTDVGNVLTGAVTGRTPGATDQVRIRAKDAAGNVSTPVLSLAVPLDVYKCNILDWVLPTNSQHAIGEQWNISFHNVSTRALVAYAPAAALVAGVNGAGQASRNLVVGNAAFAQGTTYAWFATHPTNATWFAVGLATAA